LLLLLLQQHRDRQYKRNMQRYAGERCSITFTTSRSRTVSASYPGDTNFTASNSSKIMQTVN
jgi:hypothetical protein